MQLLTWNEYVRLALSYAVFSRNEGHPNRVFPEVRLTRRQFVSGLLGVGVSLAVAGCAPPPVVAPRPTEAPTPTVVPTATEPPKPTGTPELQSHTPTPEPTQAFEFVNPVKDMPATGQLYGSSLEAAQASWIGLREAVARFGQTSGVQLEAVPFTVPMGNGLLPEDFPYYQNGSPGWRALLKVKDRPASSTYQSGQLVYAEPAATGNYDLYPVPRADSLGFSNWPRDVYLYPASAMVDPSLAGKLGYHALVRGSEPESLYELYPLAVAAKDGVRELPWVRVSSGAYSGLHLRKTPNGEPLPFGLPRGSYAMASLDEKGRAQRDGDWIEVEASGVSAWVAFQDPENKTPYLVLSDRVRNTLPTSTPTPTRNPDFTPTPAPTLSPEQVAANVAAMIKGRPLLGEGAVVRKEVRLQFSKYYPARGGLTLVIADGPNGFPDAQAKQIASWYDLLYANSGALTFKYKETQWNFQQAMDKANPKAIITGHFPEERIYGQPELIGPSRSRPDYGIRLRSIDWEHPPEWIGKEGLEGLHMSILIHETIRVFQAQVDKHPGSTAISPFPIENEVVKELKESPPLQRRLGLDEKDMWLIDYALRQNAP